MNSENKMKKIKLVALILLTVLTLSSCNISSFDSENLLTSPKINASNQQIHDALTKKIGGSYDLVYPRTGDYENAILSVDLSGDGIAEAICFYTTEQDKRVHMSVLEKDDGVWTVRGVANSENPGVTLDSINFFDFDKDGVKEIIVSWQYLSGEERAMNIFNYVGSKIKNLYSDIYSSLVVLDDALVTFTLSVDKDTSLRKARASIIADTGNNLGVAGTASLTSGISSIVSVKSAYAGNDRYMIFVDEQLENASYSTDVLVVNEKNDVSNVTADISLASIRNSAVVCTDVDGDGVPDFPVEKPFPSYRSGQKTENLYYMEWYSVKSGKGERLMNAYASVNENFLLRLPDEWTDRITVQKDRSSDRRINIYMLSSTGNVPMFCLRVFSQQEFTDDVRSQGWEKVISRGDDVFAIMCEGGTLLLPEFAVDAGRFKELFITIK